MLKEPSSEARTRKVDSAEKNSLSRPTSAKIVWSTPKRGFEVAPISRSSRIWARPRRSVSPQVGDQEPEDEQPARSQEKPVDFDDFQSGARQDADRDKEPGPGQGHEEPSDKTLPEGGLQNDEEETVEEDAVRSAAQSDQGQKRRKSIQCARRSSRRTGSMWTTTASSRNPANAR